MMPFLRWPITTKFLSECAGSPVKRDSNLLESQQFMPLRVSESK